MNGRECKFVAEGVADETNVVGGDKATELKLEQMAEARAMRRCLARSFPVGLGNYEDALDSEEIGLKVSSVDPKIESPASSNVAEKLIGAKKPKATKAEEVAKPQPEPVAEAITVEEISAETLSQVAHEEPKKEEAQTEIPAPAPVVAEPVQEPVTEATVEEVFGATPEPATEDIDNDQAVEDALDNKPGAEPNPSLVPGLDQIKRISELQSEICELLGTDYDIAKPTNREEAAGLIRELIEYVESIKQANAPEEDDEEAKDRAAFQSLREEFAKVIDEDTKFKSANGGNADPKISLRKAEITQKIVDLRRSFSTKYGKDISGS